MRCFSVIQQQDVPDDAPPLRALLQISSFPNANSMAVGVSCGSGKAHGGEQAMGLLRNADFVQTGFPIAALVLFLVNTFGRVICEWYGW